MQLLERLTTVRILPYSPENVGEFEMDTPRIFQGRSEWTAFDRGSRCFYRAPEAVKSLASRLEPLTKAAREWGLGVFSHEILFRRF